MYLGSRGYRLFDLTATYHLQREKDGGSGAVCSIDPFEDEPNDDHESYAMKQIGCSLMEAS